MIKKPALPAHDRFGIPGMQALQHNQLGGAPQRRDKAQMFGEGGFEGFQPLRQGLLRVIFPAHRREKPLARQPACRFLLPHFPQIIQQRRQADQQEKQPGNQPRRTTTDPQIFRRQFVFVGIRQRLRGHESELEIEKGTVTLLEKYCHRRGEKEQASQ